MAAERSLKNRLVWLLLVIPAALIVIVGVRLQPGWPWDSGASLQSISLVLFGVVALALLGLGIAGALGLLPRTPIRGAKVSWAKWLSASLWTILFLFAASITQSNGPFNFFYVPLGVVIVAAAIGFVVTAILLWLLFFVVDTARHALRLVQVPDPTPAAVPSELPG
jgi:hypothetical protein